MNYSDLLRYYPGNLIRHYLFSRPSAAGFLKWNAVFEYPLHFNIYDGEKWELIDKLTMDL